MLGVRPCWETMRLKKCEGESWCKDMEEGSCRFKKEWLEQRYSHFDEERGRVPPVDWSILGAAREESELQEQSYCAEQKRLMEVSEKDELEIDFDDFESTEEMLAAKVCEILQRPVKERRVATEIDELLSTVIPRAKRNKAKHEKRLLAEREMTWQVREVLRVKFRYMSKQEVLNSLKMSSSKGRKVEASNNGAGQEDKENVVKKKEIGNNGKSAKKGRRRRTTRSLNSFQRKRRTS